MFPTSQLLSLIADPGTRRWLIAFAALSLGGIAAFLLVLWAASGFGGLGLDAAGTIALIAGIIVSSALGVGLMALIFYSDRSATDEAVYRRAAAPTRRYRLVR